MMIHRFGYLCGAFVVNMLSDKFGRRRVLVTSCFVNSCVSFVQAFSPSMTVFMVIALIDGFTEAVRKWHFKNRTLYYMYRCSSRGCCKDTRQDGFIFARLTTTIALAAALMPMLTAFSL